HNSPPSGSPPGSLFDPLLFNRTIPPQHGKRPLSRPFPLTRVLRLLNRPCSRHVTQLALSPIILRRSSNSNERCWPHRHRHRQLRAPHLNLGLCLFPPVPKNSPP